MAYRIRRRSYAKRSYRRRRPMMKKRMTKRVVKKSSYNGNFQLTIEQNGKLLSRILPSGAGQDNGSYLVVPWGSQTTPFVGSEQFDILEVPTLYNTEEWGFWSGKFSEYKISGVKIQITPAAHIGGTDDPRTMGLMHIGSSSKILSSPIEVTPVALKQMKDYGNKRGNEQTGGMKRYYKVAKRNKNQFQIVWAETTNEDYSDAVTYFKWPGDYINNQAYVNGLYTVTWYVKFRNPNPTNIPAS